MLFRSVLCVLLLSACGVVEKKKSDDPTVVAEDLDQPVDLTVTAGTPFWTTSPAPAAYGGSGQPSSLQTIDLDGGEVRSLLSGLKQASSLTNDGRNLYWFDVSVTGKAQLNRMGLNGEDRVVLVDELKDPPFRDTRLLPFQGRLYWGGATRLWAINLDGGALEPLLVARSGGGSFALIAADLSGLYFLESNAALGRDLKRVGLQGAYQEPVDAGVNDGGMNDAGMNDAGMNDAGMNDAGMNDAGMNDAGMNDAGINDGGTDGGAASYPPEAPGVTLLRRGGALSGGVGAIIVGPFVYWFNAFVIGGQLMRAPLLGGDDDRVLALPSNTTPTDLATEGGEIIFALSSNAGGGIYRYENDKRVELYRLDLLSGGVPRDLRLDPTYAWFFAGGERGARLHRVIRHAPDGGLDAGTDGGP